MSILWGSHENKDMDGASASPLKTGCCCIQPDDPLLTPSPILFSRHYGPNITWCFAILPHPNFCRVEQTKVHDRVLNTLDSPVDTQKNQNADNCRLFWWSYIDRLETHNRSDSIGDRSCVLVGKHLSYTLYPQGYTHTVYGPHTLWTTKSWMDPVAEFDMARSDLSIPLLGNLSDRFSTPGEIMWDQQNAYRIPTLFHSDTITPRQLRAG